MIVARAELVRHLEQVCQDGGRLPRPERVVHHIRKTRHGAQHTYGVGGNAKEGEVGVLDVLGVDVAGDTAENRAESGVGVLEIWAGVALKRSHALEAEFVVVDSFAGHVLSVDLCVREGEGV